MLLEEFDYDVKAIINPEDVITPLNGFPNVVVSCFSWRTFNKILDHFPHEEIAEIHVANLTTPIYKIKYEGKEIGLFNSYVGAAASGAAVEELIAFGMRKLIMFGTCGVLDSTIKDTTLILPTHALRDEGTSYHYVPASEEIEVNKQHADAFEELLNEYGVMYTKGKVWTTDAIYRETRSKFERRKEQGCICVDMECSAIAAITQFREVELLHFFYSADNLDTDTWDQRSLSNSSKIEEKHNVSLLALMYAAKISD